MTKVQLERLLKVCAKNAGVENVEDLPSAITELRLLADEADADATGLRAELDDARATVVLVAKTLGLSRFKRHNEIVEHAKEVMERLDTMARTATSAGDRYVEVAKELAHAQKAIVAYKRMEDAMALFDSDGGRR